MHGYGQGAVLCLEAGLYGAFWGNGIEALSYGYGY